VQQTRPSLGAGAGVRLLLALLRASSFSLSGIRLPEGKAKAGILRAVTSAEAFLPLPIILRILGLESGRYHAWRRAESACELTDRSSCPRTSPGQLTASEVAAVKELVLAPEYRYMPVGTLARYAQRIGKVFASASTWAKLVREHGWRRPRQRVHPPKPTVGVRASEPSQIWHVDTSAIKLLDGTKVYLQAVVDNYSAAPAPGRTRSSPPRPARWSRLSDSTDHSSRSVSYSTSTQISTVSERRGPTSAWTRTTRVVSGRSR
jgi:putative transposase